MGPKNNEYILRVLNESVKWFAEMKEWWDNYGLYLLLGGWFAFIITIRAFN